jgi:putative addiction module component (TIGR02574 family)
MQTLTVHTRKGVADPAPSVQTEHMKTTDLDINKLSVAERIQLAEDLWDSVAAETGELPLTEAQTAELERRLADLERDPGAGEPWKIVRARIEQRLHKAG